MDDESACAPWSFGEGLEEADVPVEVLTEQHNAQRTMNVCGDVAVFGGVVVAVSGFNDPSIGHY